MGNLREKGTSLQVSFPVHLYAALQSEAKGAAVPMASLVRMAVKERYERQARAAGVVVTIPGADDVIAGNGDLRRLIQAYQAGRVTAQELADRVVAEEYRERLSQSVG